MHAFNLPRHLYGVVDREFLSGGKERGFEPALWFGLLLEPGAAPMLSVLLECGALYRQLPPHAWMFPGAAGPFRWSLAQATRYNTLGRQAHVLEYDALRELTVRVIPEGWPGTYLFTVEFFGDGYSREPTQSKAYHALQLDNDRLTFQPGHHVLFRDGSFTKDARMPPAWLRRQTATWSVEEPED